MCVFAAMILFIRISETIFVKNITEWEIHQYLNSLSEHVLLTAKGAADPGELPFLVVVLDERVVLCNGVIIADNLILTSSQCLEPDIYISKHENISKISVMAGVYDTSVGINQVVWRHAKELIPESNSSSALLLIMFGFKQLSEDLEMSWQVSAIQLPKEPFMGEQQCFTTGFLFLNVMQPIYQYKKDVDIYDKKTCLTDLLSGHSEDININNSICCKVDYSEVDCRTDDARILFCNKTLVGFIEEIYTKNCSSSSTHSIFMDVGKHASFFEKLMVYEGNKIFVDERAFGGSNLRNSKSSRRFHIFYNMLLVKILLLLVFWNINHLTN